MVKQYIMQAGFHRLPSGIHVCFSRALIHPSSTLIVIHEVASPLSTSTYSSQSSLSTNSLIFQSRATQNTRASYPIKLYPSPPVWRPCSDLEINRVLSLARISKDRIRSEQKQALMKYGISLCSSVGLREDLPGSPGLCMQTRSCIYTGKVTAGTSWSSSG